MTSRTLRGAAFTLGALAALLALFVLLMPKIINTDAARRAIEKTVGKDLGGTSSYDRLGLVLFPHPQIIVRNLKIEIPGKASASVDGLRIQARFLPLLQGRFAISSATLERPALTIILPGATTEGGRSPRPSTKPASLGLDEVLAVAGRALPELSLKIARGSLSVVREGRSILSLGDLEAQMGFVQQSPPQGPRGGRFHLVGQAQALISDATTLPGPLKVEIGRFDASSENLSLADCGVRLLDMGLTFSGSIEGLMSAAPKADILAGGSVGPQAAAWMRTLAGLPENLVLHTPLQLTQARLRTSGAGSALLRELSGSAAVSGGPAVSFELRQGPGLLSLKSLRVTDGASDALLTGTAGDKEINLAFAGNLESATLHRIFESEPMPVGSIKGDIRVRAPRGRWQEATAEGALEGTQVALPSRLAGGVSVERFSLRAGGRALSLRPLVLALGRETLTVEGTASMTQSGLALDLDASADTIDVKALQEQLARQKPSKQSTPKPGTDKALSVDGAVRVRVASLSFGQYAAEDVALNLAIAKGRTAVDLERASICGLPVAGKLQADNRGIEVALQVRARGRLLEKDLPCLFPEDIRFAGRYDLSGSLTGGGSWETLPRSLQGSFDFVAKKGHIYNDRIVKGVLAYLDAKSLLKSSHASLLKEGVPYDAIKLRGSLREGVISLANAAVRSKDLRLTAEGDVDLRERTLALTVLVAPLTDVSRFVSKIPIVKNFAGNAIVVVPVRVQGTFEKPEVKPLPLAGVGAGITNLMKDIVQAPVRIVEPVLPAEGGKSR